MEDTRWDDWYESAHSCDISDDGEGRYCHTHDSEAHASGRKCRFALADPLADKDELDIV